MTSSIDQAKIDTDMVTLTRHTISRQRQLGAQASGSLTLLLASVQLGCKFVAMSVRKAGIAKLTGLAGETNVQGEDVKKLDLVANEVFINALRSSGQVACMVSEENEEIITVPESQRGGYIVCFDPLDGSSNIEAGVSIGTIFGIFKAPENMDFTSQETLKEAVLRPGREMVAAGYAMYGSSTQMVLCTGNDVNGFTLDPALGEFILTHNNIRMPARGKIYSINEGNLSRWDKGTAAFVHAKKFPEPPTNPYSLRYIGSMVSDVHRTLLYGGIFMYPADSKSRSGKLRMLYECFPMAYLVEKAGGACSDGKTRMLDLIPSTMHARRGIYLGSKDDVADAVDCIRSAGDA